MLRYLIDYPLAQWLIPKEHAQATTGMVLSTFLHPSLTSSCPGVPFDSLLTSTHASVGFSPRKLRL